MSNIKSNSTILFLALIFLISLHRYQKWSVNIVGGGDSWGYYMYLPAVFIYGDLANVEQTTAARIKYHSGHKIQTDNKADKIDKAPMHSSGRRVMKFTMGLSMMYAPFFLMAHGLAKIGGWPADGYSFIYLYMIHLASLFFVLWGFWLLRKVLLKWVSDWVCSITLLMIGLGTHLYFFTVYKSTMAHAYLFFLYALLVYATQKWYELKKLKHALLIGLAAGFITLIRPTEIICLAIPMLWGITSFAEFKNRGSLIKAYFKSYLASIGIYILVGLPQLIYWKWASGNWLYYSYGEEGFDFANPHIVEGLFGFKNGWLTYTPIMLFALLGIYFLWRQRHTALLPLLIFLPLHIYFTYSWWCWYYINGFGSRPMVEAAALLSIPFALFLQKAVKSGTVVRAILFATMLLFVWQNMFQTYQVHQGLLWSQGANWTFYKRSFAKKQLTYLDLVSLDTGTDSPDESKMKLVTTIASHDFEDSLGVYYQTNITGNETRVYKLNKQKQYSPNVKTKWNQLKGAHPGDWVKISVDAMRQYEGNFMYSMNKLVFTIEPAGVWKSIRIDNKLGNTSNSIWAGKNHVWDNVYFWMQIPENINANDLLKTYVWNNSTPEIYIDNLRMEIWRERE